MQHSLTAGDQFFSECTDIQKEMVRMRESNLILASSSPRRHDLLHSAGVSFSVMPSNIDECPINGESPEDHVRRLALAKAREVAQRRPGVWVLGADTIVVIDQKILGKPGDVAEARTMLASLASRTHEVFTGYALVNSGLVGRERVRSVRSQVRIRDLSSEEIAGYVATGEPMDKAGAYAVQGIGSGIVEAISGSYTNVVGLPLCEVLRDLKELEIYDFLLASGRS